MNDQPQRHDDSPNEAADAERIALSQAFDETAASPDAETLEAALQRLHDQGIIGP